MTIRPAIHTFTGRPTAQVRREVAEAAKHPARPRGSLLHHRGIAVYMWRNFRRARAEGVKPETLAIWRRNFHEAVAAWRQLKAELAAYQPAALSVSATTSRRPTISWQTKLLYENRDSLSEAEQRWLSRCEVDWTGAPEDVRPVELARAAE